MSEETLFTQTIKCPECGANGFSIGELNAEDIQIVCLKCSARFHLFGERAGELLARILGKERARQERLTLGELLEIKLHGFEHQIGERGESAALLFGQYVESLFDTVIETVDQEIIKRLKKRLLKAIKSRGMGEGGPALESEILKGGEWALRSAGYTLVEDEN